MTSFLGLQRSNLVRKSPEKRGKLNPAKIGRQIADLQNRLLTLAKEKTEQLYLSTIPSALPDIRKGIRTKAG